MNILIKNATIITSNKNNMVINNGFVFIQGRFIKFLGIDNDKDRLKELSEKADKIIDAKDYIVLPGFVNSHTHSPMTLLRNYGSDLNLQEWLHTKIFPKESLFTEEDVYYGSMLGIAEMISTGTTCFADMYYMMDNIASAVQDSGIRSNIAVGPFSNDFSSGKRVTTHNFEYVDEFINNWHNAADGRIKTSLEVHSTYLYDISVLPLASEYASKKGVGIHIHLHETKKEIEDSLNEYNKRPIEICRDAGIFDVPVFAAHCVHLDDNDINILFNNHVSIVHNPTSNLKLASGIARIPDIMDKGINVAIGTDGASSNNNLNMIEELHLTAILHKGVTGDPKVIDAATAIMMGTCNGGKALGFDNIGSWSRGCWQI